jgi:hypothetical protein
MSEIDEIRAEMLAQKAALVQLQQLIRRAYWTMHDDENGFCLQIELGNDRAITLTIPKDGNPNRTTLSTEGWEHPFKHVTIEGFRAWLEEAVV